MLCFRFPTDEKTYGIDKQFLWGKSLMVTPVLEAGRDYVVGYFPKGLWYDFHTVSHILSRNPFRNRNSQFFYFVVSYNVDICLSQTGWLIGKQRRRDQTSGSDGQDQPASQRGFHHTNTGEKESHLYIFVHYCFSVNADRLP